MGKVPPGERKIEQAAEGEKKEEPRGFRCRKCGCAHYRVVYTRPWPRRRIFRKRECRHCGFQWGTVEQELGE